jgi:hypothetical protein
MRAFAITTKPARLSASMAARASSSFYQKIQNKFYDFDLRYLDEKRTRVSSGKQSLRTYKQL